MAAPTTPGAVTRGRRRVDTGGLVLVGLMAAWTVATSIDRPSARPAPVLGLLAATVALVLAGRRWGGPRLPGLVAVAVTGSLVLAFPEVLRAGGAPTGYANANATLASMGAIGAAAAAASGPRRDRLPWALLAVVLVAGVAATRSVAGLLALAVAVGLALAAAALRWAPFAIAAGVAAVSLTLGVTVAVADGGDPLGLGERAALRADLWASALDALRDEPWRGLGPGGYEDLAPVSPDADYRWAHHGFLQQGAEQGIPGLLLMLAIFGWAHRRLWCSAQQRPVRAVAGASVLTVVGLHASVDHVLHHAAVPLVGALLYGWATRTTEAPPRPAPGRVVRD